MLNFLFFGRLGDLASGIDKAIPYHIVSVNKMIVKWDHPLFDGDEIAFLPPVTGG
mgnify:CR=1 FL=1